MITFGLLLLFMAASITPISSCNELDFEKFLVWGPGLRSDFFMPVRYFYIQTVDKNYNNCTQSWGQGLFRVELSSSHADFVRALIEVLDFNDGVYLVRYRLLESYRDLVISLRIRVGDQQHVAASPYYLNGPVYHEECFCPESDVQKWYTSMECLSDHSGTTSYTQIGKDLSRFENRTLDMDELGELIVAKYFKPYTHSFCNYVILNNRIFKKCYGEYTSFSSFADEILISLSRKVVLPDLELFWNLGDWPLNRRHDRLLPIVSWCGSRQANDMILPTYDLVESSLYMMSRVGLDMFAVRARTGPRWTDKESRAFWRGRDSRQERLDLVLMSRQRPDLIDAALTNMFFFTDNESVAKYGPTFKYQLNIDGTVAAYRFPYLLAGDSLVFKQDSAYYEHFYVDLEPDVHYVAIARDLSNLVDKIELAKENDQQMQTIVKNAQSYARHNLTPNHIYCYHVKFLNAYSKLISSRVRVRPGMSEVINSDVHQQQQQQQKQQQQQQQGGEKSNLLATQQQRSSSSSGHDHESRALPPSNCQCQFAARRRHHQEQERAENDRNEQRHDDNDYYLQHHDDL